MSDDVETSSGNPTISETDIAFECPMCGKPMVVGAEGAGMVIICPACDQEVIVPGGPLWDEEMARAGAEVQEPTGERPSADEAAARTAEQSQNIAELSERLKTLENQFAENATQCAATAEAITQALNQATRYKVALQRLEEKRTVLESMIADTRGRLESLQNAR